MYILQPYRIVKHLLLDPIYEREAVVINHCLPFQLYGIKTADRIFRTAFWSRMNQIANSLEVRRNIRYNHIIRYNALLFCFGTEVLVWKFLPWSVFLTQLI